MFSSQAPCQEIKSDGNIESGATHLIFLPLKTVQPSGECGAKTAGAFSA